jgi:hypothetical protein
MKQARDAVVICVLEESFFEAAVALGGPFRTFAPQNATYDVI